ncbi:MAG: 1,4-beta-xylanase [Phycisphaerae bacterium]|nr:1,4-beta-xylanase [Phycisphaerae bacterium]
MGSESAPTSSRPERWSSEQAWEWYDRRPWLCGFNYVPSTAVNTTEFWQAETFDAPTIDRELGWASEVGFNTSRVFIQYLVWKHDAEGLKRRLDRFLTIAKRHGMSVMPVLFDDCAFSGKEPYLGKQADPVPGIHNSQWTASPGLKRVTDRSVWPDLERYVKDLVGGFRDDPRVILWDLYNEPGNSGMGNKSLPLLQASFGWARSAGPRQPVTVGIWDDKLVDLNRCCIEESDAISFHRYGPIASVQDIIGRLTAHGRPIICTEWMSRVLGSRWETDLPVLKQARIGCYCWGLVNGKTQTHYPWGSPKGAPEPKDWHHDLFRKDGKPYRPAEIEAIRKILRGEG